MNNQDNQNKPELPVEPAQMPDSDLETVAGGAFPVTKPSIGSRCWCRD